MREVSGFFVSDQNLLWLVTSELHDTFIDVSGDQVSIATVHLGISFLDQSDPHLMSVLCFTKDLLSIFLVSLNIADRNSVIDDDINPVEVFENSEAEESSCSELMEDWWVNTVTHE